MDNKIKLTVCELSENVQIHVSADHAVDDYNGLVNKPRINNVMLVGNISLEEIGAQETMFPVTEDEINAVNNSRYINM